MLFSNVFRVAVTCVAVAAGSASTTAGGSAAKDVRVTLQADGKHCTVGKAVILCADLRRHLREVAKLPFETTVHLNASPDASYESIQAVLDVIKKSGFNYPVGYL